ncbi:MAG: YncE family protein [Gemmataceae bacterium]
MFLVYRCTGCQRALRVLVWHAGKTLRCPGCSAALVVPAAPSLLGVADNLETKTEPDGKAGKPSSPAAILAPLLLPWMLLAPTVLSLILLMWVGHGVLWAALGVSLGGLCLFLGQRVHWPTYVCVSASLSLALLGHGLTLASMPSTLSLLPSRRSAHSSTLSPAGVDAIRENKLQRNFSFRSSLANLQPSAQLGDLLSIAFFLPQSGDRSALATTADGFVKAFTYPKFEPRATYRLEYIAYRAVADNRHGVLWTASCEPANLRANRFGDQPLGRADLHVYTIPRLQEDQTAKTIPLHPRRVVPLASDVLELLISPDQDVLFYLARGGDGVRLGRIDTERQAVDRQVSLAPEVRALCLTPDGKALYAAGDGSLYVIDPATLQTLRRVAVRADVRAIAADNAGYVYLAEQGQWTSLTRVNPHAARPDIHQWEAGMYGRIYLKLAPDQSRLFIGTSSVVSGYLEALQISGNLGITPIVCSKAVSKPKAPVRGEFFLSPDGRFLVNRWGIVFGLKNFLVS